MRDRRSILVSAALLVIAATAGAAPPPVVQSPQPTPSVAEASPAATPTPLLRRAVSTYAGTGAQSSTDGPLLSATFTDVHFIAADPDLNSLFVTDRNEIRELTKDGMVITVAGATAPGTTDGKGSAARFNGPEGIAYDSAEKALYVCDINNFEIRRVTPDGDVTTVAGSPLEGRQDGTGPDAGFSHPIGIAYDSHDGALYVTDNTNHAVRRMTAGGVVTTVAGGREGFADGIGPIARFRGPLGIAFDASDGDLYVSDPGNGRIRRVTPDGAVTTYSGNGGFGSSTGPAATARWGTPEGIAWDQFDNSLYVADSLLNTVRRISAAGIVSNIAGDGARGRYDGVFEGAEFRFPVGVAVDPSSGYLYIADDDNNLVRLIK